MLTVIMKVTNGCNMDCGYCSLGEKTQWSFMTEETMKQSIEYAVMLAKHHRRKKLSVIFHGGEPAIISPEIYDKVISAVKSDIKIDWKIQTNAYRISDEFIKLFKKHNFSVSVSLDGSEEIHNKYRVTKANTSTYVDVLANIYRLKKNNIGCAAVMVLTRFALDKGFEWIKWFENENIPLKINPVIEYGKAYENPDIAISEGEYAKYMINLYKYILDNDSGVRIRQITDIFCAVTDEKKHTGCSFSENCVGRFLSIDCNGDIYQCGRFADEKLLKFGNITDMDPDIFKTGAAQMLRDFIDRNRAECEPCAHRDLCNGGCPAQRMFNNGKSFMCSDYKEIFKFFKNDALDLYLDYLNKKKLQLENARLSGYEL